MKRNGFILLMILGISCATTEKSGMLPEDQVVVTRRYIGNFIDYCYTAPEVLGGPHLIWIKTTMYNTYGKLSALGKSCAFSPGDKIYLRRIYSVPGDNGAWKYQIENDSSVFYMVSGYRYEYNTLVQASF
jgi:hypothetical protein